jgi:hypothetical protein
MQFMACSSDNAFPLTFYFATHFPFSYAAGSDMIWLAIAARLADFYPAPSARDYNQRC